MHWLLVVFVLAVCRHATALQCVQGTLYDAARLHLNNTSVTLEERVIDCLCADIAEVQRSEMQNLTCPPERPYATTVRVQTNPALLNYIVRVSVRDVPNHSYWLQYRLPLPYNRVTTLYFDHTLGVLKIALMRMFSDEVIYRATWTKVRQIVQIIKYVTPIQDFDTFRQCVHGAIIAYQQPNITIPVEPIPIPEPTPTPEPEPVSTVCDAIDDDMEWCDSLDLNSTLSCTYGRACRRRDFISDVIQYECSCRPY